MILLSDIQSVAKSGSVTRRMPTGREPDVSTRTLDREAAARAYETDGYVILREVIDAALIAEVEPRKKKEPAPVIVDATPLRAVDSAEPEPQLE